jgi:hypothetical protein
MPQIINSFRQQENPLAAGIKQLGDTMFGDTLTPAVNREKLKAAQRENYALEQMAQTFGGANGNPINTNAAAEFGILGGMKPEDAAMWNVFLTGNQKGPRDPLTTNAMAGAGKYGDSAANLDLNRKNAFDMNAADNVTSRANTTDAIAGNYRMNESDNATSRFNNTADNTQKSYEFNNKPVAVNVNGSPGFGRQGDLANGNLDLKTGISQAAEALGISPTDLATIISYETGGTFDPMQAGPTTQWGQHKGLIQFGEPQAQQYGVDWNNPIGSQLGPNGAVVRYLKQAGVQPGMGLMDVYSAVNAGRAGRNNASDANNGGAPGTVADKVNYQMAGHSQNAARMFGPGGQVPNVGASPAYTPILQNNEQTPLDLFNGYLTAAQTALPNSTPDQQRQWAVQQISKSRNKGISVTSSDGTQINVGGDGEDGPMDLTNANQTLTQRNEIDFRRFQGTLGMATDLITKNPNSVGLVGQTRGAVQDVGTLAQGAAQLFGVQDIQGSLAEAQKEAAQFGVRLDFEYDPSVSQIESVMNILAFQGARAIGGQSGNDLSDKDVKHIKTILGDPTSLFTNQAKLLSKLALVDQFVQGQRAINRGVMGPPKLTPGAPPPNPAPNAPAVVNGGAGTTSKGTPWKVVQ